MRASVLTVLCVLCMFATALAMAPRSNPISYNPQWSQTKELFASANSKSADNRETCFSIALKHESSKLQDLERLFWEVSDPNHANYGAFLNHEQLTNMIAPSHDNIQQVMAWLSSANPPPTKLALNPSRDWLDACMTTSAAAALFQTPLAQYAHAQTNEMRLRASHEPVFPEHIRDKIDFVGGLNTPMHTYRRERAFKAQAVQGAAAGSSVMPGDGELSFTFLATCANGNLNTDPTNWCSSQPPAISYFVAMVKQARLATQSINLYPEDVTCLPTNASVCTASISGLQNYLGTYVSLKTVYNNGNSVVVNLTANAVFMQPYITPQLLRQLYNIPSNLVGSHPSNLQSVAEFLNETYTTADLQHWFDLMGLPDTSNLVTVKGPNNLTSHGTGEASLDIQVIMAIARNVPTVFWSTAGMNQRPDQEPFLVWLADVSADPSPPLVHSISFGDVEEYIDPSYAQRANTEFQKMGVRGLSVLFSAGDNGIQSNYIGNDNCTYAHPEWPASNPYVTTVGATQLSDYSAPVCAEKAGGRAVNCAQPREKMCDAATAGVITTGGGFSRAFGRQSYQEDFVQSYLQRTSIIPPASFFNRNGRAYPDITAYGVNYLIYFDNDLIPIAGTSASTPLMAGMISLLNDLRLRSGQKQLGFLNPWLYNVARQNSEAFNDIVIGENKCLVRNGICCPLGFKAAPGYDVVSGLGSPNFGILASVAVNGLGGFPFVAGSAPQTSAKESKAPLWVAIAALVVGGFGFVLAIFLFRRTSDDTSVNRPLLS